jgi:hypothetical protein
MMMLVRYRGLKEAKPRSAMTRVTVVMMTMALARLAQREAREEAGRTQRSREP